MKHVCFTVAATLLAIVGVSPKLVMAVDFFAHRQRAATKGQLPEHNYTQNAWPFTVPSSFRATAIAVAASNPLSEARKVRPFHFRATSLAVDNVILDQVGLSLDVKGRIVASGRIFHSGGDGGVIGNNVTIRLRAYTTYVAASTTDVSGSEATRDLTIIASPNEVAKLPPDAACVWDSKQTLWVSRGGPHHVALVTPADIWCSQPILKRNYENITHLEVELESHVDR